MGRFVRSIVLFGLFLSWGSAFGTAAQTPSPSSCASDILFVHPVPTAAGSPVAPLSARTLDGSSIASFPIDRPTSVTGAPGTNLVLVTDSDGNLFVVDLSNGTSTPFAIPEENGKDWQVGPVVPDSTLVLISTGNKPYLFDLASGDVHSISDRIDSDGLGIDKHAYPRVYVGNGAHLIAVEKGGFLWAGASRSHEPLNLLGKINARRGIVFSPEGTRLMYEFVGGKDGQLHASVRDEQLQELQVFNFDVEPIAFRFLDEDRIVVAMPAGVIVVDYQTLLSHSYAIENVNWLGPSSMAGDWTVLGIDDALQLLDMQSGRLETLPESEHLVGVGPVVENRAAFVPLGVSQSSIGAIEFPSGQTAGTWHVTNLNDLFDLAEISPDRLYAVGTYASPGRWTISTVNLITGSTSAMPSTSVAPAIGISPNGCIAVSSIDIVDNQQDANVDVYRIDGTLIHHFDDVSFVGWAPGA